MTTPSAVHDQMLNLAVKKLHAGESPDVIFDYLLSCNLGREEAKLIVEQAIAIAEKLKRSQPFVSRRKGLFGIIQGFILVVIGSVLSMVIKIDGMTIMFSGMVLVGMALIINGLWKTISGKDLISG